MAMKKMNVKIVREDLFTTGRYQHFRKGDIYRDPRITKGTGEKDFLVLDGKDDDAKFLASYLNGELKMYPSEEYNSYTTGVDTHGTPMIGLYWVDENMEQAKIAMILCRNVCENEMLAIVDDYCVDETEEVSPTNGVVN